MEKLKANKSDSFRERLSYFHKEYLGIPQYLFAENIGLGQERVRKSLMPDKQPTAEFFEAVFKKYPDLSPDWVFTGRGSMLLSKEETPGPYAIAEPVISSSDYVTGKKIRILSISNDSEGNENIEVVNNKAAASYIDNIQ